MRFQYNPCYYSTLNYANWVHNGTNFNTTLVIIQLLLNQKSLRLIYDFNTTLVIIQRRSTPKAKEIYTHFNTTLVIIQPSVLSSFQQLQAPTPLTNQHFPIFLPACQHLLSIYTNHSKFLQYNRIFDHTNKLTPGKLLHTTKSNFLLFPYLVFPKSLPQTHYHSKV